MKINMPEKPNVKTENLFTSTIDQHVQFWTNLEVEMHYTQNATLLFSGIPHPLFNGVLRSQLTVKNAHKHLDFILAQYSLRKLSFHWMLAPGTVPIDFGDMLLNKGFKFYGDCPRTGLKLPRLTQEKSKIPLTILTIETKEQMKMWMEIQQKAFQRSLHNIYSHQECNSSPFQHYLAFYQDEPAAAVTLFLQQGVAGIYNLMVVPSLRKRGIATQFVNQIVDDLSKTSYRLVTAQTTPDSLPLFNKLNFQTLNEYQIYTIDTMI